jgi:GR25 family glycosyltransferase involved in LPS biosynthesis
MRGSNARLLLPLCLAACLLGFSQVQAPPRALANKGGAGSGGLRSPAVLATASSSSGDGAAFVSGAVPPCILRHLQRDSLPLFDIGWSSRLADGAARGAAAERHATSTPRERLPPPRPALASLADLPVYVVTFAGAAMRQAQMGEALLRLGLAGNARLVTAFDWSSRQPEESAACFYNNFSSMALLPGQFMKPGQISNSMKHIAVAFDLVRSGADAALVLEDDAVLSGSFADVLALVLRTVPEHWDAVYLSECCTGCTAANKNGVQVTERLWRATHGRCADARLLSQSGARKHLLSLPLRQVFDWHVDLVPGMEFYWLEPFEAWQNSSHFPSTIQNGMGVANKRRR